MGQDLLRKIERTNNRSGTSDKNFINNDNKSDNYNNSNSNVKCSFSL